LNKLSSLKELHLYIGHDQLPFSEPDRLYQLPQLTQVSRLLIEVSGLSVDEFRYWIPNLFPNVVKMTVKCDYNEQEVIDRFRDTCLTKDQFPKMQELKLKFNDDI